ncbi:conserved protein of unknown function [Acidithiobacillus ferrivorans]|uniref:Uncharacterized protein n=1 Tax=Acidithiobacillus ferrivorans TaxID=160808 RepID=A0A060UQ26_9PROT|nr:hypothetical protein [Acidithiobacillus ferrivorans]CDQ10500.1 conserved hypothetical protein [Acidithiobacillus ferrivorans]SMH64530.1 conserved protein of unknown function [Acidithiobacillus ferrivorans]
MSLEPVVNAPVIFRHALSLFPAYSAEIEDFGSDATGRFSEELFAARIADSRETCEMYLDMYDADPTAFLVLFHAACDPLNKATLAMLAGNRDVDSEDKNYRHAGCRPFFWDDAAPMLRCLEESGRADVSEIQLLAVMLSGMFLVSRAQDADSASIASCFNGGDDTLSMTHLESEDDDDDEGNLGDGELDDFEELRFD